MSGFRGESRSHIAASIGEMDGIRLDQIFLGDRAVIYTSKGEAELL